MKLYQKNEWKEFSKSIIELDGNKCSKCERNGKDVILQVHHKKYIKGRKPWEYGSKDCITLCKGCHAEEHGIIIPKSGWEYLSDLDLGDLVGNCDYCDTALRYTYLIYHENWGTIEVGALCCDNLTDSKEASNHLESVRSFERRKKTFIKSKRWKIFGKRQERKFGAFDIEIWERDNGCSLKIYGYQSKKIYKSVEEAKAKAFEVIESGEMIKFLAKREFG